MDWDVTEVKLYGDHALWVRFHDGAEGTVRFLPSAFRGVFERLKDQTQFAQVAIANGVVTWPGELDLAPDAMHAAIVSDGQWILK